MSSSIYPYYTIIYSLPTTRYNVERFIATPLQVLYIQNCELSSIYPVNFTSKSKHFTYILTMFILPDKLFLPFSKIVLNVSTGVIIIFIQVLFFYFLSARTVEPGKHHFRINSVQIYLLFVVHTTTTHCVQTFFKGLIRNNSLFQTNTNIILNLCHE